MIPLINVLKAKLEATKLIIFVFYQFLKDVNLFLSEVVCVPRRSKKELKREKEREQEFVRTTTKRKFAIFFLHR